MVQHFLVQLISNRKKNGFKCVCDLSIPNHSAFHLYIRIRIFYGWFKKQ